MNIIIDLFENIIISYFLAPIATGLIVMLIGYFARVFWESKKVSKQLDTIKVAETKFIDLVKPFIIQRKPLTEEMLNDIRDSIIKEYSIDKESFMTLNDLKKNLICDICSHDILMKLQNVN